MELDFADVLLETVDRRASDLHVTAGAPPMVRVRGRLTPMDGYPRLTPTDTREIVYSILSIAQRDQLAARPRLPDSRHRALPRQRLLPALQPRGGVPPDPVRDRARSRPSGSRRVAEFANKPRGLVLVTGPTGSGKSTTLASLIDVINQNREEHIMTIEDPIEFLHRHKKCSAGRCAGHIRRVGGHRRWPAPASAGATLWCAVDDRHRRSATRMSPDEEGGRAARAACGPCRGTGRVISNLGGQAHSLGCPWCGGTGQFTPGRDAQEHPAECPDG